MRNEVPAHLLSAYDQLQESVADLDTQLARAYEIELPEPEPISPHSLAEFAKNPDAPDALKALAGAVSAGRTSWEEVAAGGAKDLPEVIDLRMAGLAHLRTALENELDTASQHHEPESRGSPVGSDPAARMRRRPPDDEDDDFSTRTFLR